MRRRGSPVAHRQFEAAASAECMVPAVVAVRTAEWDLPHGRRTKGITDAVRYVIGLAKNARGG